MVLGIISLLFCWFHTVSHMPTQTLVVLSIFTCPATREHLVTCFQHISSLCFVSNERNWDFHFCKIDRNSRSFFKEHYHPNSKHWAEEKEKFSGKFANKISLKKLTNNNLCFSAKDAEENSLVVDEKLPHSFS